MARQRGSLFFTILLGLYVGACSVGTLREDKSASGYRTGALPQARWEKQNSESGADEVFQNKDSKSVLAVNSVCDRYPDARLESLAKQLTVPFTQKEILLQEKRLLDKREALWTRLKGKLDGVPVESLLVVYRKDNCIFDFQLHAQGALSNADETDFTAFVQGFQFSGAQKTKEP